jgi:hypothetical protein
MDSSKKYPLIKLYHWNMVYSSSEPGLHLVILTLNPLFTKHTRSWQPGVSLLRASPAPRLQHYRPELELYREAANKVAI